MFEKIYESLIADLEKFYLKDETFNMKNFIDNTVNCMVCLKKMDNEALSKINYIGFSDLISMRDRFNEQNEEFRISEFVSFLFHYYSLYPGFSDLRDEVPINA